MVLPPKVCKSQILSLFSFFHICNVSVCVWGGRESTAAFWGFLFALKEDLNFKHIWNKVCSAKPRLAQELALSSKFPHSLCTNFLFLLFPCQTFRNSLFFLFRSYHPCFLLFPSTWDKMLLIAITLLTVPPEQFSLKRKKSLGEIVWLSPSPRAQWETCPGDLFSKLPLAVSPCWLLILDALLSCCSGQPERG